MQAHKIILGMAVTSLLGSCALVGLPTTYVFKHNPIDADATASATPWPRSPATWSAPP